MAAIDASFPYGTVLIVDDDEVAAQSLMATLKCAGITNLRMIHDGAEAPSLLAREIFSLVLFDLNLPWPHGAEVLRRLTALERRTPIIVVTSYCRDDVTSFRSKVGGAVQCLVKPVDQGQLLGAVQGSPGGSNRVGQVRGGEELVC